jgi:hypothetical protein
MDAEGDVGTASVAPISESRSNQRIVSELASEVSRRALASHSSQFLLDVVDAFRPVVDPLEVPGIAMRELVEYLDASRALYAELIDGDEAILHLDWFREGPPIAGRYRWDAFVGVESLRAWNAGEVFSVDDVQTDPRLGKQRAKLLATADYRSGREARRHHRARGRDARARGVGPADRAQSRRHRGAD